MNCRTWWTRTSRSTSASPTTLRSRSFSSIGCSTDSGRPQRRQYPTKIVPELPDITIYLEALAPRIVGQPLERARIVSPSLLRTVDPPLRAAEGRKLVALRRLGKRIVWEMEGNVFLVFHLMVSGRFRWRPAGAKPPARVGLGSFDFPTGTLLLTEASPKKRASLHVVQGEAGLSAHDRGGLDVLAADLPAFKA